MSCRVILADDHRLVRDGLTSLLEQDPEITVVGIAETGRQLLALLPQQAVDLVLLDISMPDMNGIEATRQIVAEHPAIRIIILSMHSERHFVLEALNAGAHGYLLKDSAFTELLSAIQAVTAGGCYLSAKIAGIVVQDAINPPQEIIATAFSQLTPRERQVLQCIAEGKSTKEIAFAFKVSIKTIETQRQNTMRKLKIHNVADLTKYAIRQGLTTL